MDVEGAEADDIIGTLVPRHIMSENILIISSDGDFPQLQMYNGRSSFTVKQYNPSQKKFIISENPLQELKEKIIRGDKGDGIPNVLSSSDCFVNFVFGNNITSSSPSNTVIGSRYKADVPLGTDIIFKQQPDDLFINSVAIRLLKLVEIILGEEYSLVPSIIK